MQGFRSPSGLQRFLYVFSAVRNLFVPPRSKSSSLTIHLHRIGAIAHSKAVFYSRNRPLPCARSKSAAASPSTHCRNAAIFFSKTNIKTVSAGAAAYECIIHWHLLIALTMIPPLSFQLLQE